MSVSPPSLAALQAIDDPAERARAATAYIGEREQAIDRARRIRDDAIGDLLESGTAKAVSELVGMSVAHVKLVQRWRRR